MIFTHVAIAGVVKLYEQLLPSTLQNKQTVNFTRQNIAKMHHGVLEKRSGASISDQKRNVQSR